MSKPLVMDYYTDILCVWAWVAQRRVEELEEQWGDRLRVRHHYLNLFGDTHTRMATQWAQRGEFEGFAQHVRESAEPFENAPVNPDIWNETRPTTSASAHLMIKAAELVAGERQAVEYAHALRSAFFADGKDISQFEVLFGLAEKNSVPEAKLRPVLDDGRALAALMNDYKQAQDLGIKGSPSWILDGGRQTLYGNVGYRVLNANIEELLRQPEQEASWC